MKLAEMWDLHNQVTIHSPFAVHMLSGWRGALERAFALFMASCCLLLSVSSGPISILSTPHPPCLS